MATCRCASVHSTRKAANGDSTSRSVGARARLKLVSSFSHHDIPPGRTSAKGVELLRQYIEFAASGGEELGPELDGAVLNPFELSVQDGLERRGIPVVAQYGVSGYRIDFACAHPDEPGRMVLAVEADGASYHSSATARDRDRLRQQVLEDKGWKFYRIWSTEWFRNREAELDQVEEAWKNAVAASAHPHAGAAPERKTPAAAKPRLARAPKTGSEASRTQKGRTGIRDDQGLLAGRARDVGSVDSVRHTVAHRR